MTLETFMVRTSLKLLDDDGGLKPSDDLPPIHTFLNRLLALRIADQNAVFADFDRILSGILERAAAAGELDRGLEDIEAEELEVTDQEVIRTDVSTGAETALVTFSLKVPPRDPRRRRRPDLGGGGRASAGHQREVGPRRDRGTGPDHLDGREPPDHRRAAGSARRSPDDGREDVRGVGVEAGGGLDLAAGLGRRGRRDRPLADTRTDACHGTALTDLGPVTGAGFARFAGSGRPTGAAGWGECWTRFRLDL